MEQINWISLPGNKQSYGLHPLMLTDDGYEVKRDVTLGRGYEKKAILITFDRDYVLWRFNTLLDQLDFDSLDSRRSFLKGLMGEYE